MKTIKLVSMVNFILDMDWLTTKEFCDKYGAPLPSPVGGVESAVNQLLTIDAIKHRFFCSVCQTIKQKPNA